ncbi:MAG: hypothetical protein PF448_08810 [Bacteroidales bacterium]|jgi:hypothetical protein|nr:hypothetical protein [Bacteroidales bacterium]
MEKYKLIKNTFVYKSNPHPTGDADLTIKVRSIAKDTTVNVSAEGNIIRSWSSTPILYIVDSIGIPEFIHKSDVVLMASGSQDDNAHVGTESVPLMDKLIAKIRTYVLEGEPKQSKLNF